MNQIGEQTGFLTVFLMSQRDLLAGRILFAVTLAFAAPISGASMNPARSFGPDLIGSQMGTYWIYAAGPALGALLAVSFAWILHGKATPSEVAAALGHERRRQEAQEAQHSSRGV